MRSAGPFRLARPPRHGAAVAPADPFATRGPAPPGPIRAGGAAIPLPSSAGRGLAFAALAALLAGVVLFAGWPALRTGFLGDDFYIFRRAWRDGRPFLGETLRDLTHPWQGQEALPYWRPLASFGYLPDLLLAPANAVFSHAVNLLVHLAAGVAAYFLALRLLPSASPLLAAAAAAVGLLGASRAEPLGWVAGRIDLVPGALLLAGCARGLRFLRDERRGSLATPLVLFAAALLWKESAIVGPIVLAALDLAAPGRARAGLRRGLYGALAVIVVAYLAGRALVLERPAADAVSLLARPGALLEGLGRSLLASASPLGTVAFGDDAGPARVAALLLGFVPAALSGRRLVPVLAAFLAWIAATLPAAPIPPHETLAGSRVLYLSGFFWAIAVGVAGDAAFEHRSRRDRRAFLVAAFALLLLLGALGLRRGLGAWRRAGDLAREAAAFLSARVSNSGPPDAVAFYPTGIPGAHVFLGLQFTRSEGVGVALVEPFTPNRRAPLGLSTFVRDGDGAPLHALRAAGARFLGFGYLGERLDWRAEAAASPVSLEIVRQTTPGSDTREVVLRGAGVDPRVLAALVLRVEGADASLLAARVDWRSGRGEYRCRVRDERLVLLVGADLAWWLAREPNELILTLTGFPAEARIAGASLEPDPPLLADAGDAATRASDGSLLFPAPRAEAPGFRVVVIAPTSTHVLPFGPERVVDGRVPLDPNTSRRLREDARLMGGMEIAWFVEALEEPGNRRSASARTPVHLAALRP